MNRIVLIGNGFDLAHGLKTSYKDFIEYLWVNIYEEIHHKAVRGYASFKGEVDYEFVDKQKLLKIGYSLISKQSSILIASGHKSHSISLVNLNGTSDELSKSIKSFVNSLKQLQLSYENHFFEIISDNYINKNWSDIEADYYRELNIRKDSKDLVWKLNKDFLQIKGLLAEYLKNLDKKPSIIGIDDIMHSPIMVNHIKINKLQIICDYLNTTISALDKTSETSIKDYLIKKEVVESNFSVTSGFETKNIFETRDIVPDDILRKSLFMEKDWTILFPESILFLTFNYTDTVKLYESNRVLNNFSNEKTIVEINQIHGTLNSSDEMIFGYGDEEDEKYKELEMLETPGLLDNMKSINYLQSSEYRNLERFIESGAYQILILGMSCGMADKTLLRKLFQHKNCISILPYYYKYIDKEGKSRDNYSELIQNISRCFSDKDLLRSIVVHKKECDPLPQCPKEN